VNKTIRAISLTILACCLFVSVGCGSKSISLQHPTKDIRLTCMFSWLDSSKNCAMAFVRHPKMTTEANEMMILEVVMVVIVAPSSVAVFWILTV